MEFKPIVWKLMRGYTSGYNAYMGNIKVGSVYWNGIDRDENLRHVAASSLPSLMKGTLGKYPTEEQAKAEVERVVNVWLKEILK